MKLSLGLALAASLLAGISTSHAQSTYFWDQNGGTTGTGGTGTWDTTSSFWRLTSSTGTLGVWPNTASPADRATFGGTAGTVTLNTTSTDINVNRLTFSTTGYTIAAPGSGTAKLNFSGTTPTVSVTTGASIINVVIAGSSGLSFTGSGDLQLGGNNSGLSGDFISGGTGQLTVTHANALGTGLIRLESTLGSTVTTTTFRPSGGINIANNIQFDASLGRNNIQTNTGNNILSGNITINGTGNTIVFSTGVNNTNLTIGSTTVNEKTITGSTFDNVLSLRNNGTAGRTGTLNSQVNLPNGSLNANVDANWTINSTGNVWKSTTISAAGVLNLGANDALATAAPISMGGGTGTTGGVNLNGRNQTVAGIAASTGSFARLFNNSTTANSILTLSGLTQNQSYAAIITDGTGGKTTSLVMDNNNAFTQTLSGTQTYTGSTTITNGTLIINGSNSSTSISVGSGGTLGGIHTLAGNVSVSGVHSPGNSPGISDVDGNLIYNADSSVLWELVVNTTAGRGTNYDGIDVGGTLTFNGSTTLNLNFDFGASAVDWSNSFWDTDYSGTSGWLVYNGATSLTNFNNLTLNSPASWLDEQGDALLSVRPEAGFSLFQSGNNIYINYAAIPEPGAALIGSLGLLALLRHRRSY